MTLSKSLKDSLGNAAMRYHATLAEGAGAYLAGRGITREAAEKFLLGYVADPVLGDEDYQGRLAIPYLTPTGCVDIRYRALTGDGPKYLGRPGGATRMFNVRDLHVPSHVIVVCEGELDTVIMSGVVGVPAVGIPGATNWKDHYGLLFEDYDRVLVACDGDQAGREFGKRVAREVEGAIIVHMPDMMDVNECYLSEGSDSVRRRLELSDEG